MKFLHTKSSLPSDKLGEKGKLALSNKQLKTKYLKYLFLAKFNVFKMLFFDPRAFHFVEIQPTHCLNL